LAVAYAPDHRHEGFRETFRSLRTPHSALRTPHSALRTPHSALRTPQVAGVCSPVGDEVTSLHSLRPAPAAVQALVRDSSGRLPLGALGTAGEASGTAVCAIAALEKASAAHKLRRAAQLQASAAQIVAFRTVENSFATTGKPSETAVFTFAPVVKVSTAAAGATTTGSNAFPTIPTATPAGSIAFPAVSNVSPAGSTVSPCGSVSKPPVSGATPTASIISPAVPHLFSQDPRPKTLNPDRL